MPDDPLVWLLPGSDERELAHARRLVSAVRLLRDDARTGAARVLPLPWERARRELAALERHQRLRTIEGLLHAFLTAVLQADSFLDLGRPPLAYESACRALLALRPPEHGLLPAPGEDPLHAAERLLARARELGAPQAWRDFWDARRRHLVRWPRESEERWTQLGRSPRFASRSRLRALAVAGRVTARLDRLDPRAALALLAGNEELALRDPQLARLFAWSALFSGRVDAARTLLAAARSTTARVPLAALELGESVEEWRAFFLGPAPQATPATRAPRVASRGELGALVLAVFALRGGRLEVLRLDPAPAVAALVRERVARRTTAAVEEPALFSGATPVRRHRVPPDGPVLAGALAPRSAVALVLTPLRACDGRLLGWIHVESDHHLLPGRSTLAELALHWEQRLSERAEPAVQVSRAGELCRRPFADEDPRRAVFHSVADVLGRRAGLRFALVELDGEALAVRAELGTALADWEELPGDGEALRRCASEALALSFEGGGGVHARAGSGACAPIAIGSRVEHVVVVESVRRRELLASFRGELVQALRAQHDAWTAAAFRAWHAERFGVDLHWDPGCRFLARIEPALAAAARGSTPLAIVGPDGTGRRTLARCLGFRGGERRNDADSHVVDLAAMPPEVQRELAQRVRAGGDERALLLGAEPLDVLRTRGALLPELANVFDPLPLEVPPLADRRDEIPGLVEVLAAGVCRREELPRPCLEDSALAELWRQDWRGNVRELASIVAQLARLLPGRDVGADAVRAVLRSRGLEPRTRLTSLRPRALDLELALRTTRHKSGATNLARAARYLGWDPDTLHACLRRANASSGDGARSLE